MGHRAVLSNTTHLYALPGNLPSISWRSTDTLHGVSRRSKTQHTRRTVATGASGAFDGLSREEFKRLGIASNEDEFGSYDPDEFDEGYDRANSQNDDSNNPGNPSPRRTYHDEAVARRNDVGTRLRNFLRYILWIRMATEMPMRAFVIPSGSGVGGNAFSEFISSIVPAGAETAANLAVTSSVTITWESLMADPLQLWHVATNSLATIPKGISLFHVGIGPFIAASIAMSVLTAVVPSLKEMTKDSVGQHTVKQYTRYIMFVVAIVQSLITAENLRSYCIYGHQASYLFYATTFFTCGAVAAAWLADEMTDRGLGQGTSVMITMSVCGAYVSAIKHYAADLLAVSFFDVLPFMCAAVLLTAGSVLVQTGTCRVPIQYFQGPSIPGLPRVVREETDHVPFKINPLGMQPVLVAVFLCEGVMWLVKSLIDDGGTISGFTLKVITAVFSSQEASSFYYLTFFLIVFGFSYLDLQNTPKEVSEYMTKIGARVPEVRPGEQTARYLEQLQQGSRFFGGLVLGVVAVFCAYADNYMRATTGICVGFTSMLIVTSTILQMKRQITAMAQMPRLDGVISSL